MPNWDENTASWSSRWRELCHLALGKAVIAIRRFTGPGTMPLRHHVLNEALVTVPTNANAFDHGDRSWRAPSGADYGTDGYLPGAAAQDRAGEAYNEAAFHYFLEIERKRSEVSNRPFLLMLIECSRHHGGVGPEIDVFTASRVFAILRECLRETDFIGWYREGRIAGAVLTQHAESAREDLSEVVRHRVSDAFDRNFPSAEPGGLQVRVYQLPPRQVQE